MKRVLVIAYFFPPINNMGSQRILRFVRHLREFGWEPVVLTGRLTTGPFCDEKLLAKLPPDLDIHRVACPDLTEIWAKLTQGGSSKVPVVATKQSAPVKTQGLTTFLNRWVMIPDKCFPWIRPAAAAGERLIREKNIAAIFSTADPLTDHLVALRLTRRTGVPWVAEFRDLWLGSPYFARSHPTPIHRAIHARLERRVVAGTKAIVCLSRGIQRYFTAAYPTCTTRSIYNSFDPGEYPAASVPEPGKFSVLYAGALYSSRSPGPFLAGWARFIARRQLAPDAAEFVIVGGSSDLDLAAMTRQNGVESSVNLVGRVAHAEALRRMQAATVLLAVQSPDDDVHLPGKLFEYVGARRPILAISRPCEVTEIIADQQLGWAVEPDEVAIAAKLDEIYAAWKAKGHDGLSLHTVEQFAIRGTTGQLAGLFEEVSSAR
jgi:glycosyltransferase involved in cell wall biosynthesis